MEDKKLEIMENELYENYMGFFGNDDYDVEENIVIDDEKSFNNYEVKLNLEFDDWFCDEVEPSPEIEKIKIDVLTKKKRLNLEKSNFSRSEEEMIEIKLKMEKLNEKFFENLAKSKKKIKKLKKKFVVFNEKIQIKNFLKKQTIKKITKKMIN